jgi:hypothetical protein
MVGHVVDSVYVDGRRGATLIRVKALGETGGIPDRYPVTYFLAR